jgi:transposase
VFLVPPVEYASVSSPQDERNRDPISATLESHDTTTANKELDDLKKLFGRALARIQKLETELNDARAQVAWFHRQLFGQKAERIRVDELESEWRSYLKQQEADARGLEPKPIITELSSIQLLLGFIEPTARNQTAIEEEPAMTEVVDAEEESSSSPPPPPRKKGHGRNRVPPTLREETIILEPDEVPDGARRVGTEVTYRVGIRRAEMIRYAIVRPKYATDDDEETTTHIAIAELPHEMIARGLLAPSGLAHVIASKWDRHVPYNRLARFFADSGYRLSVSTLSGVAIRAAPLAETLIAAMKAHAQRVAPYLAIDATGVLMQKEEACLRGHVWLRYIEDVCVLVSFTKSHDSEAAGAQLDGWSCPTLADGAQVYDRKQRETKNPRGGCWSHARRRLVYAAPTDSRALIGIKWINEIFEIECALIEATPERRRAERLRRSAPIINKLFAWRDDLLARGNLGRSLLAKALRYLRNQAERLTYFLSDGRIPIHNNLTELQARHLAVGRKNWLFFGSEAGAEAASIWLSLVLSARMHNLDVEEYLRDLFRVLPAWPKPRVLELAPHQWQSTRSRIDPLELYREFGPLTVPPKVDA